MSMFSQSMVFGENTLVQIDRAQKNNKMKHKNQENAPPLPNDDLEVIDESPKAETNILRRNRSRLKPSKLNFSLNGSDETHLQHNRKKRVDGNCDNLSEFFKSNTDFDMRLAEMKTEQLKKNPTKKKESIDKLQNSISTLQISGNSKASKSIPPQAMGSELNSVFNVSDFSLIMSNKSVNSAKVIPLKQSRLDDPITSEDIANISFEDSFSLSNKSTVSLKRSQKKSEDIFWDDSVGCDVISNGKASKQEVSLVVDEAFALGIDNVTFTEDFLKPQSFENDLNSDMTEDKSVRDFISEEISFCEEKVRSGLQENGPTEESHFRSGNTFKNPNIYVHDTTNIVLNLSDSLTSNYENKIISEAEPEPIADVANDNNELEIEQKIPTIKMATNIESWGLPETIVQEYLKKGIRKMFDWQAECLSNKKILFEQKNLVYSAPTSAGKTLVSEMLMIKNVLERKKKALIILPFISVVREKMFYLQDLLRSTGVSVEGFFGGYSPPKGFESTNIAVCTIEKANSIVNKLLEQHKIESIGCIVVDEIHLISDPSRGYILELLLAKILFVCRKYDHKIQIITMSATLPNSELLTKWLSAECYFTTFRPVELKEMIKIGTEIYDNQLTFIRKVDTKEFAEYPKDQDNIGQLCVETILEECSVILFCPSKDWCESLSHHIAGFIYRIGKSKSAMSEIIRKQIDMERIEELKSQLRNCPTGLDSVLSKSLSYACAYHHAGLTSEERDIIENGFKTGVLKVIVATSTLSSGVNLPARRVIIRTPLFGGKTMNSITYKQMIGRAGRTGKDTLGESILICTDGTRKSGTDLICAQLKPLTSCLDADNHVHLKRAILEIIASGIANTKDDLNQFTNCTLLSSEKKLNFDWNNDTFAMFIAPKLNKKSKINSQEKCLDDTRDNDNESINPIVNCLKFLLSYEFIRLQLNEETNEINYIPTRLGLACLASSMPPGDGFLLFSELQKSRQCFVLESELHAIYLVTPFSVCYQMQDIDWLLFLDLWEKLSTSMRRVGELVGIKESFLVKAMRNHKLDYKSLQIHKRFYTALALQELVNERHVNEVAIKFKCSRGLLQSLQQIASTFAGIVTSFCQALNWNMLALIIGEFKERLFFGVHRDLIDLMKIPNLNSQRARALHNKDIKSLIDLANSNVFDVEVILYNSISFDSKQRDGEDDYEAKQRNTIRHLYVTGKAGLTIRETAKLIIDDARRYVEHEMGTAAIKWSNCDTEENDMKKSAQKMNPENTNLEIKTSFNSPPDKNLTVQKRKTNENINLNQISAEKQTKIPRIQEISGDKSVQNDNECLIVKIPYCIKTISNHHKDRIDCSNNEKFTKNKKTEEHKLESEKHCGKVSEKAKFENPIQQHVIHDPESDNLSDILSLNHANSHQSNASHIMPLHYPIEESSENLIHLNIINVFGHKKYFNEFKDIVVKYTEFSLSLGIGRFNKTKTNNVIGGDLFDVNPLSEVAEETVYNCMFTDNLYIDGISLCFEGTTCYYLNLQNHETDSDISHEIKIDFVRKLLHRNDLIIKIFDAKEQLKILKRCNLNLKQFRCKLQDPKIANWLLQPDTQLCLIEMAIQYSSKYVGLSKLGGLTKYSESVGLNYESSVNSKIRSSVESCVTLHIIKSQLENLKEIGNGTILKTFEEMEMPIQQSLVQMETVGFPMNHEMIVSIANNMSDLLRMIETKIFKIHGRRFNIGSSKEVGKVLGLYKSKKSNRILTNKAVLEKIDHPISELILQHRKLGTILSNSIQPLLRMGVKNRIHGNSISFTSTGRISMQEPNLQNVAKNFQIEIDSIIHTISCRSAFRTENGRNLISADFCQLELRILTHLSQDPVLLNIMRSKEDVFNLIAAKWYRIVESEVTELQRNRTKEICYGIIYGMGIKSLAESLKCSEDDAYSFTESFHSTYPGIRSYIEKVIKFVHHEGYIETFSGRRRYFPNINSEDGSIRAQAERQAVNTIIQGSAADVAKYAMLRMERNLQKYEKCLKINISKKPTTKVDFVLHVHDELLYEVPTDKTKQIAKILKLSMENCAKLTVPLSVKVKIGNCWASLNVIDL